MGASDLKSKLTPSEWTPDWFMRLPRSWCAPSDFMTSQWHVTSYVTSSGAGGRCRGTWPLETVRLLRQRQRRLRRGAPVRGAPLQWQLQGQGQSSGSVSGSKERLHQGQRNCLWVKGGQCFSCQARWRKVLKVMDVDSLKLVFFRFREETRVQKHSRRKDLMTSTLTAYLAHTQP